MINDIGTTVSLGVDIIIRVPLDYPLPLLIPTTMLFNTDSVILDFNSVKCLYASGRGAMKGSMYTSVKIGIILFQIKLPDCDNRLKEYCNLGMIVGVCLKLVYTIDRKSFGESTPCLGQV